MKASFSALSHASWGKEDSTYVSERACPVCSTEQTRAVEALPGLQFFTDHPDVSKQADVCQVQCRNCLTLFMNPAYSDRGFEVLFSEAGRSYGDGGGRHDEQIAWLDKNGLKNETFSYMDIGCYEGQFLAQLPVGRRFIGVDFDGPAIERAKKNYPGDEYLFLQGRFEEISLDEQVDVFTMFHVLEHLPDPVGVLRVLRDFSHEKTALVVEVPVLELGFTNDIHGFFSPQHLTHFSKHTLRQTFMQAGWRIAESQDAADYNGHRVIAYPDDHVGEITADFEDYSRLHAVRASLSQALIDAEKSISQFPAMSQIAIWGAGMHLEYILQRTTFFERFRDAEFLAVDSDQMKQGRTWRGIEIRSPDCLEEFDWAETGLLISSYGGQEKIYELAIARGIPASSIMKLYDRVTTY